MRGNPQADGILPPGDQIADAGGPLEYHGERPRPEFFRQQPRRTRNLRRPVLQIAGAGDMHDHRMIGRTPLCRKDLPDRRRIRSVGTESVYRLGRKRHQPAGAQNARRLLDFLLRNHKHPSPQGTRRKTERYTREEGFSSSTPVR